MLDAIITKNITWPKHRLKSHVMILSHLWDFQLYGKRKGHVCLSLTISCVDRWIFSCNFEKRSDSQLGCLLISLKNIQLFEHTFPPSILEVSHDFTTDNLYIFYITKVLCNLLMFFFLANFSCRIKVLDSGVGLIFQGHTGN